MEALCAINKSHKAIKFTTWFFYPKNNHISDKNRKMTGECQNQEWTHQIISKLETQFHNSVNQNIWKCLDNSEFHHKSEQLDTKQWRIYPISVKKKQQVINFLPMLLLPAMIIRWELTKSEVTEPGPPSSTIVCGYKDPAEPADAHNLKRHRSQLNQL
jgi:hypothetical protein